MSDGTHSYYDWQVSTLMLAYDAVQPLARTDDEGLADREQKVQLELKDMVHAVLPPEITSDPERELPPDMVVLLTRATLQRAAQIVGVIA